MNAFRELGADEMFQTAGGAGIFDSLWALIRGELRGLWPDIRADFEAALRDFIDGEFGSSSST